MPGPKNDKIFTDALRLVANEKLERDPDNFRKIRRLAHNIMALALDGEQWAAQMVVDRLEGRPHQSQSVEADVNTSVVFKTVYEGDAE